MKRTITTLLVAASCNLALGQASHWSFFPDYKMDATNGTFSNFLAGAVPGSIGACTNYVDNNPGVFTNLSTSTFLAFNNCGVFDNDGYNINSSSIGSDLFAIPMNCDEFYALQWIPPGDKFDNPTLQLDKYNVAGGSINHVGAQLLLTNVNGSSPYNYAVSKLQPGGYRYIYVTYYSNVPSSDRFDIFEVDPHGAISNVNSGPMLQSSGGPFSANMDPKLKMEVSADGKYIIYSAFDPFWTISRVYLYDIIHGTELFIAELFGRVAGIEYVPQTILGSIPNSRVYIAVFDGFSSSGVYYYDLGSSNPIETTGLLTVPNPAPSALDISSLSYPAGYYGFSELELARNGKLYLAVSPTGNTPSSSTPGELVSLDPVTGQVIPQMHAGTAIPVLTFRNNHGYFIQNQIDGEKYNYPCDIEPCNSDFTASVSTKFPFSVDLEATKAGQTYNWTPESGGTTTSGPQLISYNYPGSATYLPELSIDHPWDECVSGIKFCLNQPSKDNGDPAIDPTLAPFVLNSDFRIIFNSANFFSIQLEPSSSVEPYYHISWGDGMTTYSSTHSIWNHIYAATGNYTICLQTGYGFNEGRTCRDICIARHTGFRPRNGGKFSSHDDESADDNFKDVKNNVDTQVKLHKYPNPANDHVTIEYYALSNDILKVRITDIAGKVLISQEREVTNGMNKFDVSLTDLTNGIYMMSIDGQGRIFREKIIVQ